MIPTELKLLIFYLVGALLANWMLRAEHISTEEEFTNGHKAVIFIFSLLSWVFVFILLIKAWALSVKPYWSKSKNSKTTEA